MRSSPMTPDGNFDLDALKAEAAGWPGIDGMDLVPGVTAEKDYGWTRDHLDARRGLWRAKWQRASRWWRWISA